ncbi:MAG: MarR family winged helix-turn-helix transcriptional regulator [Acidimicrobiales bacterium]
MVTAGGRNGVGGGVDRGADASVDEPGLEELVGLLFRLTENLRQRFAARSADLDLSFAQAMALRELDEPIPMRDLAQRLCCDASNVTGIVDHLEARGLVERRVAIADRRVKNLVLTDAGRDLRRQHRTSLTVDLPLLDELSPDERRVLADLLRRGVGEEGGPLTLGGRPR